MIFMLYVLYSYSGRPVRISNITFCGRTRTPRRYIIIYYYVLYLNVGGASLYVRERNNDKVQKSRGRPQRCNARGSGGFVVVCAVRNSNVSLVE